MENQTTQFIKVENKDQKQSLADSRILFLTTKLGYLMDELVKEKQGNVDERDIPMEISKADLDKVYFEFKEELVSRKDYYFPFDESDSKE